jgi:hypothetical protein
MSTITRDWWQRISPYLNQALRLTEPERLEWLAALREQDPLLACDVEALIQEHRTPAETRFLEQSRLPTLLDQTLAGQTLGPYTLVSPISEGGMGSVWLARRNDVRFERQAAVKLFRPPLLWLRGAGRFEREGAILARLAHPHNIAQLLDAGVSAAGEPNLLALPCRRSGRPTGGVNTPTRGASGSRCWWNGPKAKSGRPSTGWLNSVPNRSGCGVSFASPKPAGGSNRTIAN